jgi:signal transduction histidine kinase
VLQPREEALRSLYLSNTVILLFLLAIAMLAYFGAQAFARNLGKPIALLMQGAQEVSRGNLNHRVSEDMDWGEFRKLIASFNKMTADLKDYQQLQIKNQVSEMKEQVYRAVAHDLRAPLMGLQGYIYILSSGQVTEEERKDYLVRMTEAAQNLSSMLEDVLAVSRVEAGMSLPQLEKTAVAPLIESVFRLQQPIAQEKKLELSCEIPPNLTVYADPKLFRRIMMNLVSNAVKFTDKGFVKITGGEDDQQVWISVQDSGRGMTPQQATHIFEKFQQVDATAEGYGLGLFISRQLALAHKGNLTVESKVGEGSTFTVHLPKEEK